MKKILFIEICNYKDAPVGGYLSFAKQVVSSFSDEVALVGAKIDESDPLGVWFKKEINGKVFDYFAVISNVNNKKTLIPKRLISFFIVRYFRKKILEIGIKNVLIQTPEVLFALNLNKDYSVCKRIPGLENPLEISRYKFSKLFANIFQKLYFRFLKKCQIILATGDKKEFLNFKSKLNLENNFTKLVHYPSRYNSEIFNTKVIRNDLELPKDKLFCVVSGRLSDLKGWKMVIDSFNLFKKQIKNAHLIFVGQGEAKSFIISYAEENGLLDSVSLVGRQSHQNLAQYLSVSSLYISCSYVEGWSTSLMEAVAVGLPCVVTNFSSASDLVDDGETGFVIKNRNPVEFSNKMIEALDLEKEPLKNKSNSIKKYCTSNLKTEIINKWRL